MRNIWCCVSALADKKGKRLSDQRLLRSIPRYDFGRHGDRSRRTVFRARCPSGRRGLSCRVLGSGVSQRVKATIDHQWHDDGHLLQRQSNGFKEGIYTGIGRGSADRWASSSRNQANLTKPLVRVASGTPMGIVLRHAGL